jgi:hypothetical protein
MIAYLILGSSFRRSGQKPVVPATHVKPGVDDKNGPGAQLVFPTTDPATGFGIVLGLVLVLGVMPPRPVQ